FFHRAGSPTVAGPVAESSMDCFLLADLEIQGELIAGRLRDTNSRPAPDSSVFVLNPTAIANFHGFNGDMVLGHLHGQEAVQVCLDSKDKSVLTRNLGIFGPVGSGKPTTARVVIEEAARSGWAVIVVAVESEYTDMDQPADQAPWGARLAPFARP